MDMDCFSGLNSILPFLPISISTTSSSHSHLAWPEEAESSLKNLKLGPTVSNVDSGAKLFDFISKLRDELGFSSQPPLSFGASNGFSIFFDQVITPLSLDILSLCFPLFFFPILMTQKLELLSAFKLCGHIKGKFWHSIMHYIYVCLSKQSFIILLMRRIQIILFFMAILYLHF